MVFYIEAVQSNGELPVQCSGIRQQVTSTKPLSATKAASFYEIELYKVILVISTGGTVMRENRSPVFRVLIASSLNVHGYCAFSFLCVFSSLKKGSRLMGLPAHTAETAAPIFVDSHWDICSKGTRM